VAHSKLLTSYRPLAPFASGDSRAHLEEEHSY
jgi:hypothetical protein